MLGEKDTRWDYCSLVMPSTHKDLGVIRAALCSVLHRRPPVNKLKTFPSLWKTLTSVLPCAPPPLCLSLPFLPPSSISREAFLSVFVCAALCDPYILGSEHKIHTLTLHSPQFVQRQQTLAGTSLRCKTIARSCTYRAFVVIEKRSVLIMGRETVFFYHHPWLILSNHIFGSYYARILYFKAC